MGSNDGSAAKLMTVCARGSRPFRTSAFCRPAGKRMPRSVNAELRVPVDGRPPTQVESSGSAVSTLKAPTMKKVKSAAFEKRAL